jgi:hypothetical protein
MRAIQRRCLILAGLLAIGGWLATPAGSRVEGVARWPTDDALYAAGGWTVGPAAVASAGGAQHLSRDFRRSDGTVARLVLSTGTAAKRVYRAGAEVPFLGDGYTVDPAPPSLVPPAPGRAAVIARRDRELWVMVYAYGERRGLLGNGVLGWSLALLDGTLGRPNDYYLVRILAPVEGTNPTAARETAALADTLFPRLAAWYAG